MAGLVLAGGVKNTLVMASGLAEREYHVTVLAPDYRGDPPFAVSPLVRIERLATGPTWLPAPVRKLVYYLRLVVHVAASAEVCFAVYYPTVYAALLSSRIRRSGLPIIYLVSADEPTTHGALAEASSLGRIVRRLLARQSYRLPVRKVYVSRWLARVTGNAEGRTITLGIDHAIFRPGDRTRDEGPVRIGVIGRAGRVKGYAMFLAACRELRPARPVELLVVAVDPVDVLSRFPVRSLPAQDPDGMARFYRDCDVFVFPSVSEGFPAPPLEAMACGAAVVATRSGGIEEYARDGTNALLVPVGDHRALAVALERLVADAALRRALAAEGIRTAARYAQEAMIDEIEALVREVAPRGAVSASR